MTAMTLSAEQVVDLTARVARVEALLHEGDLPGAHAQAVLFVGLMGATLSLSSGNSTSPFRVSG